jgi:bifunctional non-homologous end joining protein LigD
LNDLFVTLGLPTESGFTLAGRPPSGPGWLHEIKFDGYRVIAPKDGEQVRLWARTTSDY